MIKKLSFYFSLFLSGFALLLGVLIWNLNSTQKSLRESQDIRYQSYLVADELRQSSDDLTRLARTYVTSGGDAQYEKMYWDVLAIRNGDKPRPENYHGIYWDLMVDYGSKPKPDSKQTIALRNIMENLGFSAEEFAALKTAQENSNKLVETETIAMNAAKGLYNDGSDNYSKVGEKDFEMAVRIMHDKSYHVEKAKIMAPIDKFLKLLDERTLSVVTGYEESVSDQIHSILVALGVFVIAAVAFMFMLINRVSIPIVQLETRMKGLTSGEKDLGFRLDESSTNELGNIARSFNTFMDDLESLVSSIKGGASRIKDSLREINESNETLASVASSQAASLADTSTSMEQISALVTQNVNTISDTSSKAAKAEEKAVSVGDLSQNLKSSMGKISESSHEIENIIQVIDEIAFQTNLLALNAAVEAARAGEQGRGFAVVASEVRNLARRSSEAAKEIKDLIEESVVRVDQGTEYVEKTIQNLDGIVDEVKEITVSMSNISRAAGEQDSGIAGVNSALLNLDKITQSNEGVAKQNSTSSAVLLNEANEFLDLVSSFKIRA